MPAVMVIDDDPQMRALVRAALPEWDMIEGDGEGSDLEHFLQGRHEPKLIMLDMQTNQLDGYDICSLIRAHDPGIPILPLTADQESLPFLEEMGCAAALHKPVSQHALRAAAYQALAAPRPPFQPGAAVLAIFQQKAAARARQLRQDAQPRCYGLLAANPITRVGLSTLLKQAGLALELEAGGLSGLRRSPRLPALTTLIAASDDWPSALEIAQAYTIPLLVVAAVASAGAAIALLSQAQPIGVLVLDRSFPHTLQLGLQAVAAQQRYIAPTLQLPFPHTTLSAQEQKLVALALHGLTASEIASVLGVAERSVAQYQTRICQKLEVRGIRGLFQWAKAWERDHPLA